MDKLKIMDLGISVELAEKIIVMHNDDLRNYIPKSRFDEVNTKKKELESKVSAVSELEEKLKVGEASITSLKEGLEKATILSERSLLDAKKAHLTDLAIIKSGARDTEVLKGMLASESFEYDSKDNKLVGLDEKIASIKNSYGYIFGDKTVTGGAPPVKDKDPAGIATPIDKMSYNELVSHMEKNPGFKLPV
jgi:hypothetical protein